MRRSSTRLLLAAALAVVLPAAGQTPQDAISNEVEVRVVNLEVFVDDRDGRPVPGLTRDDFELLHNGEPIEIAHFSPMREGVLEAPATEPSAAPAPRAEPLYLVIYVDYSFLEPGDLHDVLEPLAAFLRTSLAPGDQVLLATARRGFEIRQGFTTVPELVTTRFDELTAAPGGGRLADEYRAILQSIQRHKALGSDRPASDPRVAPAAMLSRVEAFAAEVADEVGRTAGQLAEMVGYVAGLPGRKVILYLGGRVPTRAGRELFEVWNLAFGRTSDNAVPTQQPGAGASDDASQGTNLFFNLGAGTSHLDAEKPLQDLAALAGAQDVTLHTVDLGGLRQSGSFLSFQSDPTLTTRSLGIAGTPQLDVDRATTSTASLATVAAITGGRSLAASRNFDGVLAGVEEDFRSFYSLGFVPPPGTAGEERGLTVRLRDSLPRHRLRYRKSYRLKSRDQESVESTVSALLLGGTHNPLEVELALGPPRVADGKGYLQPLSISLPLANLALVADGRAHSGRLSVFVTSGDGERGVEPVRKSVVPVRIANDQLLTSLGRRVEYTLDLPVRRPGPVAVTVRDDFRPRSSTATASPGG